MIKLVVSSALMKIFDEKDCLEISCGKTLKNESFAFQIYAKSDEAFSLPVRVESDLTVNTYLVKKMKGDCYCFYGDRIPDDYEIRVEDNMYPELLRKTDALTSDENNSATLFVEVPADEKSAGVHTITVFIGNEKVEFPLTVLDEKLVETDLVLTHWFHMDGIADYYAVKPFSPEFYELFESFLAAYKKMGNTTILVPIFTPPLDTQVGTTRTPVQLVGVKKDETGFKFDFSELEKYILLAKSCGIKYFEISHLFSQWGGVACPNIVVREDWLYSRFGWLVSSESEEYQDFLRDFLPRLIAVLEKLGVKDNCFFHVTDEPNSKHIERYERLSNFVKELAQGIPIMDALSHYEFMQKSALDLPVVVTSSDDFDKFKDVPRMFYYCTGVDKEYLSNRYFHHPLQRTAILGYQLYANDAKGFLQWGYNFYNARESKWRINPYKDATAGGEFPAGDAFIVYPGVDGVEYSIRYFAMLKAFEEERLMETLERKIGKEAVKKLLADEGVVGMHTYPRSAAWHEQFRLKVYDLLT